MAVSLANSAFRAMRYSGTRAQLRRWSTEGRVRNSDDAFASVEDCDEESP